MTTLATVGNRARLTSVEKGFYEVAPRDWPCVVKLCDGEKVEIGMPETIAARLMLVTTEVAEACEALRERDLRAFAEELADVVIRVASLADGLELDLDALIAAKLEKNEAREHRHGGKCL